MKDGGMLSRVADSLYWMSRYLERAEHTARLMSVGLTHMLDQAPQSAAPRWARLLAARHAHPPPDAPADALEITQLMTFDTEQSSSIATCVALARENARQVREQISSEMWEQLNRLYLKVRQASVSSIWDGEPIEFFQSVKEGAHLFQGLTDATMTHDQGWDFIQVGRYLERASATALLLDVHFQPHLNAEAAQPLLDLIDWIGLLKCATSFEAYCRVYSADVRPAQIAEFLLLNSESPRSVRFALDRLQDGLQAIGRTTGPRAGNRVERLAGRLRAELDYAQVEEIMSESLHAYLERIQRQCGAIHKAIYGSYIAYPVETALAP
jgi:uncharacterized alpha-E superfamily protein